MPRLSPLTVARRAQWRTHIVEPPRRPRPLSPYVRLLKPMPQPWKKPGSMGAVKSLDVWRVIWVKHHDQWVHDVEAWLAEQRMALTESMHVGPHAQSKRNGA